MHRLLIASLVLIVAAGCSDKPLPTLAGGKPVSHWVQALKSDADPKARKEAAFKLGNVGPTDAEAYPALVAALSDRDPRVRCEVIVALVKFGPSAHDAVPRLTELRNRDRDTKVRTHAAKALERLQAVSQVESASVKQ